MIPRNIFVLRHGQSIGNVDWRWYQKLKDEDIYLTPLGARQAQIAASLVEPVKGNFAIYTSNYLRAIQTGDMFREVLGDRVKFSRVEPDIRELKWMDHARKVSLKKEEDQREHMKAFTASNPGGESAKEVYDRMEGVISRLYQDFSQPNFPENVVIVSHGITIRCFMMKFLNWPTSVYESLDNPHNCQVFHLSLNTKTNEYDLTTPFPRQ
jgi:broad specificity phosphatase PhoE